MLGLTLLIANLRVELREQRISEYIHKCTVHVQYSKCLCLGWAPTSSDLLLLLVLPNRRLDCSTPSSLIKSAPATPQARFPNSQTPTTELLQATSHPSHGQPRTPRFSISLPSPSQRPGYGVVWVSLPAQPASSSISRPRSQSVEHRHCAHEHSTAQECSKNASSVLSLPSNSRPRMRLEETRETHRSAAPSVGSVFCSSIPWLWSYRQLQTTVTETG